MSPKPQEKSINNTIVVHEKFSRFRAASDDDEIVISGISGKFPNCNNAEEFEYNLYNKVDMVKSDGSKHYIINDLPNRVGKVLNRDQFDSTFFRVHFKQAKCLDPQARFLLESAYECVLDAGVNPSSLRGTKTGVFIGASFSEAEKAWFYELILPGGFGITGCCRAMMANRISYCLGLNGPSYLVDCGGSSSLQCLTSAYNSLRNGEIDAAIVGGANVILFPYIDMHFKRLGMISKDGYCRPFDQNSSGYNRSETITTILLQRKRDAKRIYAQLVHARSNYDGYKADGIAHFATESKKKLLTEFYNEIKFDPQDLGYIEANANGVPYEDVSECDIIDSTICKQREEPLMIGSIKSNIGQTDAASGLAGVIKCCFAFKNNKIPPNLHYVEPRKEIHAIQDGRLKVVKEVEQLKTPYVCVNSYSLTGQNSHVLLKAYDKYKVNNGLPDDNLPRLLNWGGRTEESIEYVFRELEGKPFDSEYIGLLHEINATTIPGFLFRGYGLINKDENGNSKITVRDVQHYAGIQRPVVWVFSGMGSQWTGMGTALMEIPIVRESLLRCHKALEPKGLNLIDILTSNDPHTYDNILHSFVGIAAIQIALVDLLRSLNLKPDYIIGHSVGELGCGYADGGFTPEQMILCSYSRGKVSLDTEKIFGSMAAVGLGYNEIVKLLPSTIEVACRNSFESSTISGPAEEITAFVNELKTKKIFAKEVPCSNIAYHSKYIAKMGPYLLKYLKEILPNPKPRSEKWLSSSVPKNNWHNSEAQFCSAEYHTNNLLNSVLFEDTANMLPKDAICIEIAPHGLLQAILKRSMPNAIHIGLTQRGNEKNHHFLLQSLGKIFLNGVDMPIQNIYPKVKFPVSNGTRSVSSLIKWEHTENWLVTEVSEYKITNEHIIKINLRKPEYQFLYGYKIDNRIVVPPMFLVQIIADFYATLHNSKLMQMGIQFDNIKIKKYLFITESEEVELLLMIQPGNGNFSITQKGVGIIDGRISTLLGTDEITNIRSGVNNSSTPILSSADFYTELELRGQEYQGIFKSVLESHGDSSRGKIKWSNFYFSFLESLIQVATLHIDTRNPMLPWKIRQLRLFGKQHLDSLIENEVFNFEYSTVYNRIVSGGVEIAGLETKHVDRKQSAFTPNLSLNQFIPNFPSPLLSKADAVRCCIQTAAENFSLTAEKMKVVECLNENQGQEPLVKYFMQEFMNTPKVNGQCFLITDQDINLPNVQIEEGAISNHVNCTFIVLNNALDNVSLADEAAKSLMDGAFMISRETLKGNIRTKKLPIGFNCVAILNTSEEILILLKKVMRVKTSGDIIAIKISESDNKWITEVKNLKVKSKVILYTENEKYSGILGMVHSLKDFANEHTISFFFIDDKSAPSFNLNNDFYRRQIELGLVVNIFKEGQWGSYKNLYLKQVTPTIDKFYAEIDQPGDLQTLKWYQGNHYADNMSIEIAYAGINSRDIFLATGRVPKDSYNKNRKEQSNLLGVEFSGIDMMSKKRIMGIRGGSTLSSYIERVNSRCVWNIPAHWSLEQAATVPFAYTMIYYAYFHIIKVCKGFSILIHDGASDLGVAAIRVAIASGLNVFTTVRSKEQKDFLLLMFTDLNECHIGSCLDNSFEEIIQDELENGVNIVLNTLPIDMMITSLRCLSKGGHLLEFGRFDMSVDNVFGMGDFLKEITLHAVSLERFLAESDEKLLKIHNLVQFNIDNGIIVPLPLNCFAASDLKEAFSFATKMEYPGKIVIDMKKQTRIDIKPQIFFDPTLSYIVCDNFNVFGIEFIDWMVMRGAKNILLHAKKQNSFQANRIAIWRNYGVNLLLHNENITTKKACLSLLETAKKQLGPVGGIFNLNSLDNKTNFNWESPEEFIKHISPKINQVKYLEELSIELCPKLNYFVLVTNSCNDSVDQLHNNMLNSIYEQIIESRYQQKLPAKLLIFGTVEHEYLTSTTGYIPQKVRSCLATLDELLLADCVTASSLILDKNENLQTGIIQENIYEEILNLTGITDETIVSNKTKNLSDIGINPLIALQIQKLLDKKLNLNLSFGELNKMELSKIKMLSSTARKSTVQQTKLKLCRNKRLKGMAAILPQLEDVPTNLDTLVDVPNFITEKNAPVIIIPGIEGTVSRIWYDAVKSWNLYPIALQLHGVKGAKSIKEMAELVFKDVHNALRQTTKFFFVAYSFGSMLALELAALLEKYNYKGKILLIDGAPHFMNELLIRADRKQMTNEEIIDEVLTSILSQIDNQSPDKLLAEFSNLKTYDEKLNKLKEYIKLQNKYTEEYIVDVVETMYNRIQMIKNYKGIENKLSAPIILVKPKEVSIIDIEEDYKLSKLTINQTEVKYIDGDHFTILEKEELSLLVNDFNPNRDIQQNFQNYLDSGFKFEIEIN